MLTLYLHHNGVAWVVFTMVPFLGNIFRKLGFQLHHLGPADKSRLGDAAADWGSYYDGHPQLMAVSVAQAHGAIMALTDGHAGVSQSPQDGEAQEKTRRVVPLHPRHTRP